MTRKPTLLPIAVGAILQASVAAAQAPQPSNEQGAQGGQPRIEEVIVQARKREESFQDVPVVATVLTQETLERTKTDDLFTVAKRVPSLVLGNSPNSSGTQVSLRGVGTTALNATMDQSVSLVVDGVPISQSLAYASGMFDLAQIEVLKGPQSLFFGKNNTAGAISLRSADPTDVPEFIGRAGYEFEAEEREVDVVLSGPVSDSLKLRLATRYSDQEGFFRNEAVATPGLGGVTPTYRNYFPVEEWIVKGAALYEPGSIYTARLKLSYASRESEGGASPLQLAYCPEGTGPVNGGIEFLTGENCKVDRVVMAPWFDPAAFPAGLPNNGVQFEDTSQVFGVLEQTIDFTPELSLTSVTGYYESELATLNQGSNTSTTVPVGNNVYFDNQQLTQELRLTSDYLESPVNFMVGGFYQRADMQNEVRFPGNVFIGAPAMLQHADFDVDVRSISIFGQILWDITPALELAAGARWTDEEREMTEVNLNPGNGPVGPVPRPDPKISSTNVSPEVTLTYKPTDTLTAFASYKTGFKSGSFNTYTFVPSDRRASFDDEEVRGGEIGLKAASADRSLSANISAYLYRYTDLQVGALELERTQNQGYVVRLRTINAASADVKGVDFDVSWSPRAVEGLTLTGALNYNRARYDSFTNAPCGNGQTIAQGCNQLLNPDTGRYLAQDLSGRRLVRAPDWSGFVGFNQEVFVGSGAILNFGAGANYMSEYSTALVDLPGFEQEAFWKFDANVSLRDADGSWEVALIGANLGNELTRAFCANANTQNGSIFGGQVSGGETGGPAGEDEAACYVERGREVWLRVSLNF